MANSKNMSLHRPDQKPLYFGALDGFRGIFALMVAIHHSAWFSYVNYRSFIDQAFVIIDLFFAFSGFLLYILYHDKLSSKTESIVFLKRRFARLYPLHIFMILVFVAYSGLRLIASDWGLASHQAGEALPFQPGASENLFSLFTNVLLLHSMGIHDSLSFNYPSWTVSVEFYTYFLFMAIMVWAPPKKVWHFAIIALGVIAIYYGLSQVEAKPGFSKKMNLTYDYGFFRCVAGFFIGVIAAKIFNTLNKAHHGTLARINRSGWTMLEVLIVFFGGLFLIYCTGPLQFYVGPVILIFMIIFAFDGGYISWFMSRPIFQYLAKISYSVYLVHAIISIIFVGIGTRLFPEYIKVPVVLDKGAQGSGIWGDIYMIPYLLIVIAVSHITYHLIEVPGGRALRNLTLSRHNINQERK